MSSSNSHSSFITFSALAGAAVLAAGAYLLYSEMEEQEEEDHSEIEALLLDKKDLVHLNTKEGRYDKPWLYYDLTKNDWLGMLMECQEFI